MHRFPQPCKVTSTAQPQRAVRSKLVCPGQSSGIFQKCQSPDQLNPVPGMGPVDQDF